MLQLSTGCHGTDCILFAFLDSLLGCGITDDGVRKICELVRANLVETVQ